MSMNDLIRPFASLGIDDVPLVGEERIPPRSAGWPTRPAVAERGSVP